MFRFKIILFITILHWNPLTAQEFSYKNIDVDDGLPSSNVYQVLQDRQGYIWFATNHGVARYNGKEFTNLTIDNGLPDNTILRMFEDKKGRIWLAALGNGICYFQNNKIHKIPGSEDLKNKNNSNDYIDRLYVDSALNIWVGTNRSLFFSEAKRNYSKFNYIRPSDNVTNEYLIVDNSVFKLYNHTLYSETHQPPSNFVLSFHKPGEPSIPLSVWNYFNDTYNPTGKYSYSYFERDESFLFSHQNTLIILQKNKKIIKKKFDHDIIHIKSDSNNNIWIFTLKGGAIVFKNGDLNSDPVHFLDGITANDVCIDNEGGTWITTLEKGIFYIPTTSILVYPNIPFLNDHIIFIGEFKKKLIVNTYGNAISQKQGSGFVPENDLREIGKKLASTLWDIKSVGDTSYLAYSGEIQRMIHNELKPLKNQNSFSLRGKNILIPPDNNVFLLFGGGILKINYRTNQVTVFNCPFG